MHKNDTLNPQPKQAASTESGFTLVELVVALLVISVLAAGAYSRLANTDTQASWHRYSLLKPPCCRSPPWQKACVSQTRNAISTNTRRPPLPP